MTRGGHCAALQVFGATEVPPTPSPRKRVANKLEVTNESQVTNELEIKIPYEPF